MADSWYYNVDKGQVEQGPSERGFSETRLGPFATEAEAAGALAALHRRNDEQDEADRAWREG